MQLYQEAAHHKAPAPQSGKVRWGLIKREGPADKAHVAAVVKARFDVRMAVDDRHLGVAPDIRPTDRR